MEEKSLTEELKKRISEDTKEEPKEEKPKIKKKKSLPKKPLNEISEEETLIPIEDYIKCAVHLGTKVITPNMRQYVYKRRADGLAVINTHTIDKKIREAIKYLSEFNPDDVYLACKREAGWKAANKFHEITGIRIFTKKYPAGVTTNPALDDFFEAELTIICDPWIDRNPLQDTARLKKKTLALCDTNNFTKNITKLISCNNKSNKSIGCILYLLARGYAENKGLPFNVTLEDFTGPLEDNPSQ